MDLHLIQSRVAFGPEERRAELREVWRLNDAVFTEQTHPVGRPTFSQMFAMCKPDRINYITNADIFFLEAKHHPPEGHVWALSRYDIDARGKAVLWAHPDSQDTWIVRGGPHEVDAPFPMGVPGCDNALLYALQVAGFKVSNPSKTIRTYHLHNSAHRTYLSDENGHGRGGKKMYRIPPPYAFAKPTEL